MTTIDIIIPLIALGIGAAAALWTRFSVRRFDREHRRHPAE